MRYRSWGGTTWRLRRWNTDHPITIQILVEAGLQRFQRRAGARIDGKREEVAATVGIPDRKLIGAGILQGDLVAACRLLHANRRIRIELPHHNRSAAVLERRAGPTADAIQKII